MRFNLRSPLSLARKLCRREEQKALLRVLVAPRDLAYNDSVLSVKAGQEVQFKNGGGRKQLCLWLGCAYSGLLFPAIYGVSFGVSFLFGCNKYHYLGMSQLGQNILFVALAASSWISFQHRVLEKLETVFLLQPDRRQLFRLAPSQETS